MLIFERTLVRYDYESMEDFEMGTPCSSEENFTKFAGAANKVVSQDEDWDYLVVTARCGCVSHTQMSRHHICYPSSGTISLCPAHQYPRFEYVNEEEITGKHPGYSSYEVCVRKGCNNLDAQGAIRAENTTLVAAYRALRREEGYRSYIQTPDGRGILVKARGGESR